MTELRQVLSAADADLRRAVDCADFSPLPDAELVSLGREIEATARLLDAARAMHAAEVARRAESRTGMAATLGFRGTVDTVAGVAGISAAAAKQRIRTGAAIAPTISASGAAAPPRFPVVAGAVRSARLGIDVAGLLIAHLESASSRVGADALRAAERSLVDLASGSEGAPPLSVELVRRRVAELMVSIDPDGVRPREERAHGRRSLRFGREDADGLTPVHGALLPIVAAQLKRLCDAHIKAAGPAFVERGSDSGADSDGVAVAAGRRSDTRTREQKHHDVLGSILDAAARVADAPQLAGAPPVVLVTVTQDALEGGRGAGFIDGLDTPISLDAVERLIDNGGAQPVTLNRAGAVLALGSVQRCFTPSQRRAISARDGGCIIPGCPIPAGWCEVHHVIPHRAGGATHVDNGVLLCWWHHHIIDSGPWRIRMQRGVPQVRGPGTHEWTVTTKRRGVIPSIDPPRRTGATLNPRERPRSGMDP